MAKSKTITRNDIQNILAHINLGDDAHREITQAEFDALSQTDKDDGTIYFITNGASGNVFLDDNTPIGMIAPYGGTSDPAYWLICDGRAVSRTTYAELFAVIGTTYGTGDGSTTFNIPDLKGRVAVGAGNSEASGATNHILGQKSGEETHTLNVNEMPNHKHDELGGIAFSGYSGWPSKTTTKYGLIFNSTAIANSGRASTTMNMTEIATSYTGGSTAHNNMQPYTVTNYIIKASSAISTNQSQLDYTYPVGSYYETSNLNFNPNIVWGGIWELSSESSINKKWHRIT